MKKLMENWRKYLVENKEEYLKSLGLHIVKEEGEYNVYLYEWNTNMFKSRGGWPYIVGTLGTMKMDDQDRTPCIPTTQEVGSSAVREQRKGRGIGTHMYEVVAYYIKMEQNGGITSDHSASTTKDAARVWAKLRDKLNYVKRKTPKGPDKETFNVKTGEVLPAYKGENDKFDYNNSTPDPNDDCYEPSEGKPASPNSLQIPASRMGYIANLIEIQLDNFDEMMTKAKEFNIKDVRGDGASLFSREYDPYISGIHGEED